VALKRYRSHPMMLIGDEPQSYPSYRDIALSRPVSDDHRSRSAALAEAKRQIERLLSQPR